jgi:three-Cys-motif partner protein
LRNDAGFTSRIMPPSEFHEKPYDAGTLAKLKIFELYTQAWIPVFLAPLDPKFREVHIFDFFSGPGKDSVGAYGSPLLILSQIRSYHEKALASWNKVKIVIHLFDSNRLQIEKLSESLKVQEWQIPGVTIDCRSVAFQDALVEYSDILSDRSCAKLLIIDQFGVDEVTDDIFRKLITLPTTDFIFFLSSSTLYRFRDHPAIKQKIDKPDDSYDVHRAAVDYYRKLIPSNNQVFLGSFSIRKRSNIYGLIFGSRHPLGIHKFLQVAWDNDQIAGEANFDIDRDNIKRNETLLALDVMRPNKKRAFEEELELMLRTGKLRNEAEVVRFCIEAGMTCKHSSPVLKRLKNDRVISLDFQTPNIKGMKIHVRFD